MSAPSAPSSFAAPMAPFAPSTISAAIAARASRWATRGIARMRWSARSMAGSTISMARCAAPPGPNSFPPLDKAEFGLRPVEMEMWHGLIFLRFRPGPQPAVAELLKPFDAEICPVSPRRNGSHRPRQDLTNDIAVNWKSVRDVDNEGYHVAMAHPALQDLYGSTYRDIPMAGGINMSRGEFQPHAGRRWSVRNYVKLAGGPDWLPERSAFGLDLLRPVPQQCDHRHPRNRAVLPGVSGGREPRQGPRHFLPAARRKIAPSASPATWPTASTARPMRRILSYRSGRMSP